MTDLLTARASAPAGPASGPQMTRRPLWLGAGIAGAAAAGSVLVCCMAVALVGWFASDAGSHGDTRDAIRVGADAWLLALGAPMHLATATISVIPLGLTAFSGYVAFRLGRWAALTSVTGDLAAAGLGAVVLSAMYAVVALVTAVLAAVPAAQVSIGRAFLGGLVVGAVGGGLGILSGSGLGPAVSVRVPQTLRAVVLGGLSAALLLLAAGSVLVVVALGADLGAGANVLSRLHAEAPGAALYTVVVAGVAPNAALLGVGYLLGPGFAVGTGTIVSPHVVELGPIPAFPLLAALPDPGPTAAWTTALVAVPVLLAGVATALTLRRHPAPGHEVGALRGLGTGVLGGVLTGLLVGLAGGSAGPGRMADLGASFGETLTAAVVAMAVGGVVAGVVTTWWQRRSGFSPDGELAGSDPDTEETVRLGRR